MIYTDGGEADAEIVGPFQEPSSVRTRAIESHGQARYL